jgi:hypothetical protein
MSNSFDDLMNDPEISDRVKDRLRFLKKERNLPPDDDFLFVLAEFGFLNKMWAEIPDKVTAASQAAKAAADSDIALILGEALTKIAGAEAQMKEDIGEAAKGAAGQIAKQAVDEINDAIKTQQKIDYLWSISVGLVCTMTAIGVAIAVADAFHHVKTLSNVLPAEYATAGAFIKYLFDIPVGYFFIVSLLCSSVLLGLKLLNDTVSAKIDSTNKNGGYK